MSRAAAKSVFTVDFGGEAARRTTVAPKGRVPRVVRLLALAHRIDAMIRAGQLRDLADAARACNLTRARMTQISNLLLLAPKIQEAILELPLVTNGRDPITERTLRPIVARVRWDKQCATWSTMDLSALIGRDRMSDELTYRVIAREKVQAEDCPWFNPLYSGGDSQHDHVAFAIVNDECVCYALFAEAGDVEIKYVENGTEHHGKGYALDLLQELTRRFPDRIMYGVATRPRSPSLLRKAGFASPEEIQRDRGGFRIGGAWVRFPEQAE